MVGWMFVVILTTLCNARPTTACGHAGTRVMPKHTPRASSRFAFEMGDGEAVRVAPPTTSSQHQMHSPYSTPHAVSTSRCIASSPFHVQVPRDTHDVPELTAALDSTTRILPIGTTHYHSPQCVLQCTHRTVLSSFCPPRHSQAGWLVSKLVTLSAPPTLLSWRDGRFRSVSSVAHVLLSTIPA